MENIASIIKKCTTAEYWCAADWMHVIQGKVSKKGSEALTSLLGFARNNAWDFSKFREEFSKRLDPVSEKLTTHYRDLIVADGKPHVVDASSNYMFKYIDSMVEIANRNFEDCFTFEDEQEKKVLLAGIGEYVRVLREAVVHDHLTSIFLEELQSGAWNRTEAPIKATSPEILTWANSVGFAKVAVVEGRAVPSTEAAKRKRELQDQRAPKIPKTAQGSVPQEKKNTAPKPSSAIRITCPECGKFHAGKCRSKPTAQPSEKMPTTSNEKPLPPSPEKKDKKRVKSKKPEKASDECMYISFDAHTNSAELVGGISTEIPGGGSMITVRTCIHSKARLIPCRIWLDSAALISLVNKKFAREKIICALKNVINNFFSKELILHSKHNHL